MTARASRPILTGRRVLVVEDEALIAMQIEAELEDAGCMIVGPAATAALALRLIQREAIDAAVLDYRLGDENSREIASRLVERAIPFILVTGHAVDDLPSELCRQTCLAKPVDEGALLAALEMIVKIKADAALRMCQ